MFLFSVVADVLSSSHKIGRHVITVTSFNEDTYTEVNDGMCSILVVNPWRTRAGGLKCLPCVCVCVCVCVCLRQFITTLAQTWLVSALKMM